jgi:hypothetical protein
MTCLLYVYGFSFYHVSCVGNFSFFLFVYYFCVNNLFKIVRESYHIREITLCRSWAMISANLGCCFATDRAFSGRSNRLGPEFGLGLIWALGMIIFLTVTPQFSYLNRACKWINYQYFLGIWTLLIPSWYDNHFSWGWGNFRATIVY